MTFNDIFKSSFLNNITSISIFDMSLALLLAFGVGMFIFFVYKKTFSGVMYSSGFGVTLIALTMITTLVILAVTSNVVLSLGMVGALSIVRFIGSLLIGIVLLVFVNRKTHANPYIAVISCTDHASEVRVHEYLEKQVRRLVVKSKTAQKDAVELNLEIRLKDDNTDFVNTLAAMEGVNSAVLVSYNGDYMG